MKLILAVLALGVSLAFAQDGPRVYVSDSQSWEMSGGGGGTSGGFGGAVHGGARPQTAEVIKTLGEKCPTVRANNIREKADYIVLFDHEGGKGWVRKDNKIAVFNKNGDSIISKSTVSLGGAVEEACKAIARDWEKNAARFRQEEPKQESSVSQKSSAAPELKGAKVSLSSAPTGADIEIDGAFVGSTPSSVELTAGDHVVVVKKSGYKPWERKVRVSAGDVNLSAELERQ
ncbi:MAG: PEGA domain-containing protein [Candidatus Koribacter versatilis]|uniref:PEGA domain-containing protein n=1 Tax=Candidatus Korobacter versatilis TaxID=658062 RepID=A0A932AA93_9BACT|nr:PEGA domain-containing protein [Candidatus Koribacter versatilis]